MLPGAGTHVYDSGQDLDFVLHSDHNEHDREDSYEALYVEKRVCRREMKTLRMTQRVPQNMLALALGMEMAAAGAEIPLCSSRHPFRDPYTVTL